MPALQRPAIIFDLDNTVVHSRIDFAGIRSELGALLVEHNAAPDPIVTEGPQRRSIGQIIELGTHHDALHGTRITERMWQIVVEYELAGMRVATIEADAVPTLQQLRKQGHPLGILTNNARESAIAALQHFELLPYLDVILGREDVPEMKPSPTGLEVARERLRERSARLLMVGDSYLDGLAAQGADCPFVAFRPRMGDLEERGIKPIATIQQLSDLLALVQ